MLDRRRFLTSSLALTAAVSGCAAPRRRRIAPGERLNLGFVGVANRAAANLEGCAHENVVALCDVDRTYLDKASADHPWARLYRDFRVMLERERLDGVVISTADHTHFHAARTALDLGLDVYCEKPLTHSVTEARILAELARARGAVTQMGTQVHASDNYRRVVELVRSGAIGEVREAHAWVGKAWGGGERPTDTPPVPAHLDYDLWLGPAPYRPYHPDYLPAQWRRWWDFGGGTLGDMGCHLIDLVYWACDPGYPTRVAAEGPPVHPETAPTEMRAHWSFPARGERPPLELWWHDGGKLPPALESGRLPKWGMGVLFVGDEGELLADYGRWQLFPEERFAGFTPPEPSIPASSGHYREWTDAVRTRAPTTCRFEYAGPLTETVLLGNVAYRSGQPFAWDAEELRAGTSAAQGYLAREYRRGWELGPVG